MSGGLAKALGLGSSQALVRLVCSFLSIKVTAVYLGPAGLGTVAQFNGLIGLCQSLIGSGVNTATVRLGAEYSNQPERLRALLSTGLRMALAASAMVAVAMVVLSPWLAGWLLKDSALAWAAALAGLAVVATTVSGMLLGALNSLRDITRVATANMLATVVGLLLYAPACALWGLAGGLAGSAASYGAALVITLALLRKAPVLDAAHFKAPADRAEARRIMGFYPMLLAHAAMAPLSLILVRDAAATALGTDMAGLWQATWRLSETYTMLITSTVSLYFMPRLGQLANEPAALRREVWLTLGRVLAITAGCALMMWLLRHWVVRLVFAPSFAPVAELMPMQLLADVLKMGAWTLGFVLVSQMLRRWYVALELLVPATMLLLMHLLLPTQGLHAPVLAYAVASALHLGAGLFALRHLLLSRTSAPGEG